MSDLTNEFEKLPTGKADYLASLITQSSLIEQVNHVWILMLLLIIFVHLYHTFITNIGTASVTLIPIILSVAPMTSINPISAVLLTNVTLVFGFRYVTKFTSSKYRECFSV